MTPKATGASPRVAVIGLGYIGLPTAAVLAMHGIDVIGVDVNPAVVEAVNNATVPFAEPDLEVAVAGAALRGKLKAQAEVPAAEVYVIAVPTPFTDERMPDLSFVDAAADSMSVKLHGGELVLLESTCPPGATRRLADRVLATRPDLSLDGSGGRAMVHFAHCPERVLPGRIMVELVTNDRIVGGLTPAAAERAKQLYGVFCQGEILTTTAETAELAKLVENSYRDVNIAFANEVAQIAEELDVDTWELIELANRHPRVNILRPGPGVGGHCIAVDPWFLVAAAPEHTRLVRSAREVNDARPAQVTERVIELVERTGATRVAALGLAFKADVDDLRESPARQVVAALADKLSGVEILAVEPHVSELPPELAERENVQLVDHERALREADVAVLLVDHSEFRDLDLEDFAPSSIVDTRGLWRTRSVDT